MGVHDAFSAELWAAFADERETVTYTSISDPLPREVSALWNDSPVPGRFGVWRDTGESIEPRDSGRMGVRVATPWVMFDDPNFTSVPNVGDSIVRAGVTWTITEIPKRLGNLCELIVETRTPIDRSRRENWRK